MISNLPKMPEQTLKSKLKLNIEEYVNTWIQENYKNNRTAIKIIDIRIAETSFEIFLREKLGKYDKIKKHLMKRFIDRFDPNL